MRAGKFTLMLALGIMTAPALAEEESLPDQIVDALNKAEGPFRVIARPTPKVSSLKEISSRRGKPPSSARRACSKVQPFRLPSGSRAAPAFPPSPTAHLVRTRMLLL